MLLALIAVSAVNVFDQGEVMDSKLAERYFQEAKWISDDDSGKLWGKTLYGPMVFVDPKTRELIANEKPGSAGFVAKGSVYSGRLPAQFGIANYAFNWEGKRWTMVMWPLPTNRAERSTLMMHELYHRIQPELGHGHVGALNAHLESMEGRIWLQLELKALADALVAKSQPEREKATTHALLFRQTRQRLFETAKKEEDALEINEGLAQFTGYIFRGGWEPESRMWLSYQLQQGQGLESYSRRFAYLTGGAYAFLLNLADASRFDEVRWRKNLKPDSSLSSLLAEAVSAKLTASPAEVESIAAGYGYENLKITEAVRDRDRKEKTATIKANLIDGPVLILPLKSMRNSFRNDDVFAMGADGTFFAASNLIDQWGSIDVTSEGILVGADYQSARVKAPASATATTGPGWKITLKPGWKIVPGQRKGDYTLSPSSG
jgi:hypothetical protein